MANTTRILLMQLCLKMKLLDVDQNCCRFLFYQMTNQSRFALSLTTKLKQHLHTHPPLLTVKILTNMYCMSGIISKCKVLIKMWKCLLVPELKSRITSTKGLLHNHHSTSFLFLHSHLTNKCSTFSSYLSPWFPLGDTTGQEFWLLTLASWHNSTC